MDTNGGHTSSSACVITGAPQQQHVKEGDVGAMNTTTITDHHTLNGTEVQCVKSSDVCMDVHKGSGGDGDEHDCTSTINSVLSYWFGEGRDVSADDYVHNGQVWWKGTEQVDSEIQKRFGNLVVEALEDAVKFDAWKKTPRGSVALIIILDQFTRNVFRGSPRMFEGDDRVIALSKETIKNGFIQILPLPQRLFVYMPFQHSEKLEEVEQGVNYITQLCAICPPPQKDKYDSLLKSYKKHADIIKMFGRYPHRNEILGRVSTAEEFYFLRKNLNKSKFMQSVTKKSTTDAASTSASNKYSAKHKKPLMKVLVFHSFRQNASVMKKRTGKMLKAMAAIGVELVYINAPISFEPKGEDRDATVKAFGGLPPTDHQRCFWTATDDNSVYEGIDISIRYMADLFATQGPFGGIIAFSHGAAMGGILAALQPFESVHFQFCILISGFPARAHAYQHLFLPNTIKKMPSMHIVGTNDILVSPERTRALAAAFEGSVILEHFSGHFVPNSWPVDAMCAFVSKFLSKDNNEVGLKVDHVLQDFQSKIEATFLHSKFGEPIGICDVTRDLLKSTRKFWEEWLRTPQHVSRQMLNDWVATAIELAKTPEELVTIVEDLFVVGFSGRIHEKVKASKIDHNHTMKHTNDLFYQLVVELYVLSPKATAKMLGFLVKLCDWRDLVGIAVQGHRTALLYHATKLSTQTLDLLQQDIVQLFATQLVKDIAAIEQPRGMPSACVEGAPRIGSAPDKECGIGLRVAKEVHHLDPSLSELALKTRLEKLYRNTLTKLRLRLKEASSQYATNKQLKRKNLELSDVSKLTEQSPISGVVVNPEPEPVTVAPLCELQPLFEYLQSNKPVPEQTAFIRGTLLPDGRLDLCKMVVGGTGIKPLLDAMQKNDTVKRLLLGNNVVGNEGAKYIAQYINNGSKLTTWYIAGNDITAEGLTPICKALEGDTLVEQLWLKRNPLLPQGVIPLANLLRNNTYLHVLDLVNTGILDDGTRTLFEALPHNTTLKHLYLGSNGITHVGAAYIADYFKNNNNTLHTLYLSLNRIGDEGARKLAEALKTDATLRRFSVASNRLTAAGAGAILDVLVTNPSTGIELLDFGFTKATSVLGELGNIMGDVGAAKVAEALTTNTTLRSLDIVHNAISQKGFNHIRDAMQQNTTLTTLNFTQFGKPLNEYAKEEVKRALQRNCTLAGNKLSELQKIDFPTHISEILSVYRTHVI